MALIQFIVAVAATLTAAIIAWTARLIHRDVQQFIAAVELADERSRDNTAVLDEAGMIEESGIRHMSQRDTEAD